MNLISEVAALHGNRYRVTIMHEAFADCGCPHATGARIRAHEVVIKEGATLHQATAISKAWVAYSPRAVHVTIT